MSGLCVKARCAGAMTVAVVDPRPADYAGMPLAVNRPDIRWHFVVTGRGPSAWHAPNGPSCGWSTRYCPTCRASTCAACYAIARRARRSTSWPMSTCRGRAGGTDLRCCDVRLQAGPGGLVRLLAKSHIMGDGVRRIPG